MNADGSFRMDDVPPGTWELHVSKDLIEPAKPTGWGFATGVFAVTVPPMSGEFSQPLDVGTIEMHRKSAKTGPS